MRSRNLVIGVVASLVVLALAAGLLLLVESVGDDDLQLPERVGDLRATDTAGAYAGKEVPPEILDRRRASDDFNSAEVSEAFDGAAVDTRAYVDPDDDDLDYYTAVAVAGDTGPLLPDSGFADPAELGYGLPTVERTVEDDVECLLYRSNPPRSGASYEPDRATPDSVTCQRRSGRLSVRVRASTGDTDAVVDLVDDLWDELD